MPRTCRTDANVMREGADMIRKVVIALGAVSVIVLAQPASAQNNTVGGALLGGGLGAIIGGQQPAAPAVRLRVR